MYFTLLPLRSRALVLVSHKRAPSFVIRHSPFVIRHSSFVIRHSSFATHRSPFPVFPSRNSKRMVKDLLTRRPNVASSEFLCERWLLPEEICTRAIPARAAFDDRKF